MIAIGYGRVSTTKQATIGASLDAQENICRTMAQQDGITEFIWLVDAGISGKNSKNRPAYLELIKHIGNGNCKIYAYHMSRLGRSFKDIIELWELCENMGVSIRTYADHIDTTGPYGKFVKGILALVNQLQREIISENTKDILRDKKSRGEVYSAERFGYKIVGRLTDDEGKVLSSGQEVEDDQEMEVVKEMNRLWNNKNKSLSYIARYLNYLGNKPKKAENWTHSLVRNVLIQHKLYEKHETA
jgi:site-specific DNA recombinase